MEPTLPEVLGVVEPTLPEVLGAAEPTLPEVLGVVEPTLPEVLGAVEPTLPEVLAAVEPTLPEVLGVVEPTLSVTADVIGDVLPVVCWPPQPDRMSNRATHATTVDRFLAAFAGVVCLACEISPAKSLGVFTISSFPSSAYPSRRFCMLGRFLVSRGCEETRSCHTVCVGAM